MKAVDIHTKEDWLNIIRLQGEYNDFDLSQMLAALIGKKYELRQLKKAFPQLVEAIKEYKKNG